MYLTGLAPLFFFTALHPPDFKSKERLSRMATLEQDDELATVSLFYVCWFPVMCFSRHLLLRPFPFPEVYFVASVNSYPGAQTTALAVDSCHCRQDD